MAFRIAIALITLFVLQGPVHAASSDSSTSASTQTSSQKYTEAESAVMAKNYSLAVRLFTEFLASDNSNANAWNYLAYSHRKLGKLQQAEQEYKKALILNPGHLGAHEYLGELYVETGRLPLARQLLDRLRTLCSQDCEEYEALEMAINNKSS